MSKYTIKSAAFFVIRVVEEEKEEEEEVVVRFTRGGSSLIFGRSDGVDVVKRRGAILALILDESNDDLKKKNEL